MPHDRSGKALPTGVSILAALEAGIHLIWRLYGTGLIRISYKPVKRDMDVGSSQHLALKLVHQTKVLKLHLPIQAWSFPQFW
ncbi:uncharacterized protein [Aristolochia californica]|uniref:uncharacterized protein isoform X2 n=1 Tax=Aristolochia californica TaxID=171875 RepID=UPI0035DFD1AB